MTTLAPRPVTAAPILRRRSPVDDVADVARVLATAYLEVRDGHRPARCLIDHTNPIVARRVEHVVTRNRRRAVGSRPVTPLRVVTSSTPRGVDACVVLRHGARVTAVAMRLEVRDGRWLVTSLGTPEDSTRG